MTKASLRTNAVILLWTALAAAMPAAVAQQDRPQGKPNAITDHDAMILIPLGKFVFGGAPSAKTVELPAFLIDKYEVTNRQFARFNLDHKFDPELADVPATMVSLHDARNHCEALDKRLPTEQEWEKAARGTDGRVYPWGNEFDVAAAVTGETDFKGQPAQALDVGSRERGKSPYGVMDMSGNVWEWTSSFDGRYAILKGGSFFEDRNQATAVGRLLSIPDDSKDYVGFRCVKEVKPK